MQTLKMFHSCRSINNVSILTLLISFTVFMTVFNRTVISTWSIVFVYASVIFLVLFTPKFSIHKCDLLIICLFYVVPFFWIIVSSIHCFVIGHSFTNFFPTVTGRLANYFINLCMYLVIRSSWQRGNITTERLLRIYSYGCSVLLVCGWWQFANYVFGVPFFNIETRNHIHSMGTYIGIGFRITSIAEEPAYLVPYLIDLFIIIFYKAVPSLSNRFYIRNIFLVGIVGLLLLSLSLSAYCNLIFIIFLTFIFMQRSKRKFFFSFVLFLVAILIAILASDMIFAVLQRLNFNDLMSSVRLQDVYLSIRHMLNDASPFTLLFGYGPKGFGYMKQFVFYITGWRTGENIGVTSHLIFADFFVEYGLVGLAILIGLFCLLWYLATRVYRWGGGRITQLLVANLLICCLYTADYASPRFTILLIFIVCMYLDAKRKKR